MRRRPAQTLGFTLSVRLGLALALGLAACGGGDAGPDAPLAADAAAPDAIPACVGSFRECLDAADGVVSVEEISDDSGTYLHVGISQPVDHDAPGGATFVQYLNLLPADRAAPTVLLTSGYAEYYRGYPAELTQVLGANQVALEHRFFGESFPSATDWSTLTVAQAAADQHRVVQVLRPVLTGAWVSTGVSKGGMTATYHRRFYPRDVAGTVPMSAPMSFAYPDDRYDAFLEQIGDNACRTKLLGGAEAMLGVHRAEFIARTEAMAADFGLTFLTYSPAQSLQDAVKWLLWGLYQIGFDCAFDVPAPSASADDLWDFLTTWSNPTYLVEEYRATDDSVAAYRWQAAHELGMQEFAFDQLAEEVVAPVSAGESGLWTAILPSAPPAHTRATMDDIAAWLDAEGEGFVFLYGAWDPWSGGAYDVGDATDTQVLWVPQGHHSYEFAQLTANDRAALFDTLERWTGVTPTPANAAAARRTRDHVAHQLQRLEGPPSTRRLGGTAAP